jgi:hypothetical protein
MASDCISRKRCFAFHDGICIRKRPILGRLDISNLKVSCRLHSQPSNVQKIASRSKGGKKMKVPSIAERPLYITMRIFCITCLSICRLWWSTPWYKAYIVTAVKKYIESSWYRDRLEIGFRKRQVIEMLFNHDIKYFEWKISRRERLGIFLAPYSYIHRAKLAVREAGLTDYF